MIKKDFVKKKYLTRSSVSLHSLYLTFMTCELEVVPDSALKNFEDFICEAAHY